MIKSPVCCRNKSYSEKEWAVDGALHSQKGSVGANGDGVDGARCAGGEQLQAGSYAWYLHRT